MLSCLVSGFAVFRILSLDRCPFVIRGIAQPYNIKCLSKQAWYPVFLVPFKIAPATVVSTPEAPFETFRACGAGQNLAGLRRPSKFSAPAAPFKIVRACRALQNFPRLRRPSKFSAPAAPFKIFRACGALQNFSRLRRPSKFSAPAATFEIFRACGDLRNFPGMRICRRKPKRVASRITQKHLGP